jgi:hypothetical protein
MPSPHSKAMPGEALAARSCGRPALESAIRPNRGMRTPRHLPFFNHPRSSPHRERPKPHAGKPLSVAVSTKYLSALTSVLTGEAMHSSAAMMIVLRVLFGGRDQRGRSVIRR